MSKQMTEAEARDFLDACGMSISRRLNTLYEQTMSDYRADGVSDPTVSVHAFGVWELSQQDIDERGMVAVGELRDGDATAVLMMSRDGEMEVRY